jgi:hypothetical protein
MLSGSGSGDPDLIKRPSGRSGGPTFAGDAWIWRFCTTWAKSGMLVLGRKARQYTYITRMKKLGIFRVHIFGSHALVVAPVP